MDKNRALFEKGFDSLIELTNLMSKIFQKFNIAGNFPEIPRSIGYILEITIPSFPLNSPYLFCMIVLKQDRRKNTRPTSLVKNKWMTEVKPSNVEKMRCF